MEVRKKLIPVEVTLWCDGCGGAMHYVDTILMSSPPQIEYKCEDCDTKVRTYKVYPIIEYINEDMW